MKTLLYGTAVDFKHQKKPVNLKTDQQNVIQSEKQREKRLKKSEQSQRPVGQHQAYQLQNGSPGIRGERKRAEKKN